MAHNRVVTQIIQGKNQEEKESNKIKAKRVVDELLETEIAFQGKLFAMIEELREFQKRVKNPNKSEKIAYINKVISVYSTVIRASGKIIDMLQKGEVEDKLLALREVYEMHAKQYFDALSSVAERYPEFNIFFSDPNKSLLSKKELNNLKKIFYKIGDRADISSYLIEPVQRGPRHELLLKELNKVCYLDDSLIHVQNNVGLINNRVRALEYLGEIREAKKYVNKEFSSVKNWISIMPENPEKEFLDSMLITLESEFLRARKSSHWNEYIKKIEDFSKGYAETFFNDGKKGKMVLDFLEKLKISAEAVTLVAAEAPAKAAAEASEKMADAMFERRIKERSEELARLPKKLSKGVKARIAKFEKSIKEMTGVEPNIGPQGARNSVLPPLSPESLSFTARPREKKSMADEAKVTEAEGVAKKTARLQKELKNPKNARPGGS